MRHVTTTRFTRSARTAPVLLLALVLAGCGWARGGNGEGSTAVGWKTVMSKVPPAYLIAVDRSQCTVAGERFAEAKEGESFFCAWSRGAVATAPPGGPLPGEEVGIPDDPDRPRLPPMGRPPRH